MDGLNEVGAVFEVIKEPLAYAVKKIFKDFKALDVFNKYIEAHEAVVASQVQNVRILGMGKPILLKDLYYPTQISDAIARRRYKADWLDGASNQSKGVKPTANGKLKLMSAEEFVSDNKRVVILGGPGAGKTTFLKFVALAGVDGAVLSRSNFKQRLLPVFIHLPKLAKDGGDIFDHICKDMVDKCDEYVLGFYKRALETDSTIVLLDSLDEVPSAQRSDVVDKIKNFGEKFPNVRILVSCRAADYREVLEGYSEVEISKLSREAVKSIVSAWFKGAGDLSRGLSLLSILESDSSISSLAETPLLLSLLCIQYKYDLSLPKRKTELYRRCVDALLKDWDSTRNFRRDTQFSQLSDDKKEKLFESVAGMNHLNPYVVELDEREIVEVVAKYLERIGEDGGSAKSVIAEMESHHGIIEKMSQDSYAFSHFSMHEYFLARYICSKRVELDAFRRFYQDESWFGILQFVVALMDDPSSVFEFLMKKSSMAGLANYPTMAKRLNHLWLLFKCLSVGVSIDVSLRRSVCRHIAQAQLEMASIYMSDKVFPVAKFVNVNIAHAYFYIDKKRNSLESSLAPYRRLANEILISPQDYYSDVVDEYCKDIDGSERFFSDLARDAFLVCLILPLASSKVDWVLDWLTTISARTRNAAFKSIVNENKRIVESKYKVGC